MKCERCGREYKSEECPTKGQAALCGDCRFRLDSGECNCYPYEPTCSFCQIRDMEEHTKMAGEIIDLRAALSAKDAEIERLKRSSRHPNDMIMLNQQQTKIIEQAQVMAEKDAEIERLRKSLEGEVHDAVVNDACMSFRHDYGLLSDSEKASTIFQAMEWLKAWGRAILEPSAATRKALGEAGKKEPDTCVWTVNVTENSWILGCDESKDTSAPPKVCPYCKKRVEVRG